MAGNITLTDGSGTVLASDEVDGAQVLHVKVQFGGGDAGDVTSDNPLPVAVSGPALSVYRSVGLVATTQSVTAVRVHLHGWHLANTGSAAAFVKLYDSASAPAVGTVTPRMTLFVPAGGVVSSDLPGGIAFWSGIAVAATTGASDADTTAPSAGTIIVNLFWV